MLIQMSTRPKRTAAASQSAWTWAATPMSPGFAENLARRVVGRQGVHRGIDTGGRAPVDDDGALLSQEGVGQTVADAARAARHHDDLLQ
ncbi:MAG: hypothetical protein R2851_14480 [Caldilineaceae bacterium]